MSGDEPAEVGRDHFATIVADWSQYGPPLRPSPADVAVTQAAIDALGPQAHAAILGVTPEIAGCTWPSGTGLTVVDHSPAMIASLWHPERAPAGARAVVADWRAMPLAAESIDLVAGDGCYIVLPHPDGYAALTREVHRVLRSGARFVIRVFLRPDAPESVADVAAEVRADRIGSVHALKLRLLAALHAPGGGGTRLDDVWHVWKTLPVPAERPGWTPREIAGIESYRGLAGHYYLPTLAEMRAVFGAYFVERACATPAYELGERCPTFVLER